MPESTVIRTKRDGQIAIIDGTAVTPNTYTVLCDLGDFNYSVPGETIINPQIRGKFGTVPILRLGNDQAITFGWTNHLADFGDTAGTPSYAALLDVIHRYAGGYVATNWKSTLDGVSDVWTYTVSYTVEGSDFGESDKTVTFNYCVLTGNVAEGDSDTLSISGTCYQNKPVLS